MINYYVDPGSGFVFAQSASFLWGIVLGLFGTFFFFFRFFFRFFFGFSKRFIWLFLILLAILIIGGIMIHSNKDYKKVIILGIDAMDPNITEQLIQEGRLPNFSYLKKTGAYSRLATTIPTESVVAWTSFATGLNPGSHGIFDFIMRDPKTYMPYLTLSEVSNVKGQVKIQLRRKGITFFDVLSKYKIPCFIYFLPNTFPPERVSGYMLSGMGVPDLYGTIGRFSFYTTKALTEEDKNSRGKIIHIEPRDNVVETGIYGPKVVISGSTTESSVPLRINFNPKEKNTYLEFQGVKLSLKQGEWSNWQKISFKIGLFKKAYGILRFYLKSIEPELELYLSPINFDPQRPLFPISYPGNFSNQLAKKVGPYYTQGMPHDTWGLTENRVDEKAFLEHADEILNERERILSSELKRFKGGIFFFYFDTLDAIQHMFWRYLDKKHPLYEDRPLYKDAIFNYYEKIDRIIGNILKIKDKDTILIVLSDHGFSSFRKSVHLNSWLLENGYLFLKEGAKESRDFFEDVDWSRTKAYALGFGGIYLNRIGREYYGVVNDSETLSLKQAITNGLKKLRDPDTQEIVVKNVYAQEEVFKGPSMIDAPDLFVGFNAGYRASWQTALGGTPNLLIEENKRKWSGDHLIDASVVPGIIFSSKKAELRNPSIIDIAPTALDLFGIKKTDEMKGGILFDDENK